MDTWALGIILYEMVFGITPFNSTDMRQLIRKINDGRYRVTSQQQQQSEKISIETCLFLLECLQSIEANRMSIDQLLVHPFVQDELKDVPLNPLNDERFIEDQGVRDKFSDFTSSQGGSIMLSRFDDSID